MYRVFDLLIASELSLPWVSSGHEGCADWSVRLGVAGGGFQRFHAWNAPDGTVLMQAARRGEAYLLEFPELARFVLDFPAREVVVEPASGSDERTLAHLLLDQVLPRAVCHRGRCIAHASAVRIGAKAVAFAGVTGRGKSTLAAAFHRRDCPVVGDDCLLIEPQPVGVTVLAAYRSLRLWPDSAEVLSPVTEQEGRDTGTMACYSDKRVLSVPSDEAYEAVPLSAICLLDPPAGSAARDGICLAPARGVAAVMPLIEAQFALDVVDRDAVTRVFEAVRRIAGRVPVYRLGYPRDFDALGRVVEKITGFDFSRGADGSPLLLERGGMQV